MKLWLKAVACSGLGHGIASRYGKHLMGKLWLYEVFWSSVVALRGGEFFGWRVVAGTFEAILRWVRCATKFYEGQ